MTSWTTLNLIAWVFGLKAVYDLRAEFAQHAKTWVWLTWALWCCLLMELAMLGVPHAGGLALVSILTGIASGILLGVAFRSLHAELRAEPGMTFEPGRFARSADPRFAALLATTFVASIAFAHLVPGAYDWVVRVLHPVEGAIWLGVSGWLVVAMLRWRAPAGETGAHYYRARTFAFAFAFAFAGAARTPMRVLGAPIDPAVTALISTLFVLTLVTALYALVLRLRGAKLAGTAVELHRAREQLMSVERLAAVGTLAAGAAHDFNNCLTTIVTGAQLASEDTSLSPATRQDLAAIEEAAMAAAAVTRNLLGIARRSTGGTYRELRESVLAPLESLERELRRHHIEVITRCDRIDARGIDPRQLFQVCLNLYLNARDAMIPKRGGTLEVSLRPVGDSIELRVKDTGTGIPAAFRPRMFEPLATTKGENGTGLGLAGSRSIVESMGGRIAFESTEGVGTEFIITLPVDRRPPITSRGRIDTRRHALRGLANVET